MPLNPLQKCRYHNVSYRVDSILCSVSQQTVSERYNTITGVYSEETLNWEVTNQRIDDRTFKVIICSSHSEHRSVNRGTFCTKACVEKQTKQN